jgi:hypothetical protein
VVELEVGTIIDFVHKVQLELGFLADEVYSVELHFGLQDYEHTHASYKSYELNFFLVAVLKDYLRTLILSL